MLLLCLSLALALQQPATAVIDRILAVVGTDPIMLSDVTAAMQFHLIVPPAGTADPTAYVLDQLIRRDLMLGEVDRFQPPMPDPAEIATRVDGIERQAGSPAAFDRTLAVTGMTRDQLRQFVRDDLRIRTYLLDRFGSDRPQEEFNAAVEAWVADLRRRAQVTVLYQPR
jgi:hypothetical protein